MLDHDIYMETALEQAREALRQGQFPVGAVFVGAGKVVATGQRAHSCGRGGMVNEIDHAEILALRSFLVEDSGIESKDLVVYSTMEPCLMCYSTLILNGVRNFVYAYEDVMGGGTNLPLDQLHPLYSKMRITITPAILRAKSLKLFKQFFSNPDNRYWKDSLLANYTMNQ